MDLFNKARVKENVRGRYENNRHGKRTAVKRKKKKQ